MRSAFFPALALAALLAAGFHAGAAEPEVSPAALEERVRGFLEAFIDPTQAPEEQARFFAEGADYYRFGPSSRREIIADIRRHVRRWPVRSYRLQDIEYVTHDPATDDVFVSYVVEFDVANRKSKAHGRATYGAVITDIHSDPQIGAIMERIAGSGR